MSDEYLDRRVSAETLDKLKKWEGLRLEAYKDVAGVWTIGYGHTGGPDAVEGKKITKKKAEQLLRSDLARFERSVFRSVKVELNDNQFGALVSFAFNVGVFAFESSTLLKELNKGNYSAVPKQLLRWNKATDPKTGKKVEVPGLTNRRMAEIGLWNTGAFVASQFVEPEEPQAKKINVETKAGGLVTALGTVGTTATETATQLNFLGDSPTITAVCVLLVMIGFGLTIYGIVKNSKED